MDLKMSEQYGSCDGMSEANHNERRWAEVRPSIFTIGHSNHPIEKLIELLQRHEIDVLVDTRSQPYSRYSLHFSRELLERSIKSARIRYLFMGDALGGRPSALDCYDEMGKVLYDNIEKQDFYQRGIERLLDGICRFRVCLLCSEEDPIRCHRRLLIARTLIRRGIDVHHIRGSGELESEGQVQVRFDRENADERQMRFF
jgi:uncharacterized protein (DUF488 family)